jgi:sugar phosphate isomerase/epimerase
MNAWRAGTMPIGMFIEFAKEVGVDGIEILDAFLYEPGVVRDHLPDQEFVLKFTQQTEEALARKVHALSITNDFNHLNPTRLKLERSKIEFGISLARLFDAPVVRVFSGNPTSTDGIELVRFGTIDALKDLSAPGVTLALENHGAVFATPSRINSILEPIKKRNVGLCFDIGNFLLADVDPVEAALLLPAPSLIHVKDFTFTEQGSYRSNSGKGYDGCRLGDGVVPIKETLKVLLEKLDGKPIAIDLELECGEDGIESTRLGVEWLREAVARIA